MKKLSVLMVVAYYPATYGHTTVIDNLCAGLKKLGHRTAIGAFRFHKDPPFGIEKIKLSKIKLLTKGVSYLDFDIIHSHQSRVNYFLLTIKPTKPIILHYHGASNKIQELNFKLSMSLYGKRISKIISVSKAGIDQMSKIIGPTKAEVIYNGVDAEFYNADLPKPYKKGDPQLLFVSALREYKNAPFLVKSMPKLLQKYPKAHLQIVGDGPDFEKLVKLVKDLNLQQYVELTGKISNDQLRLRYSSCDIYVSASGFEVCPVPTLEAMACGKPLVLLDIAPHKEITELSKAGVTFRIDNESEFIEKIIQVYENKKRYEQPAIDFAQSHNWDSICRQTERLYESLY